MDASKQIDDQVDIIDNVIWDQYPDVLENLLKDHTTHKNIIWATDDYRELGQAFDSHAQIMPELISGRYVTIVMPRIKKERSLQFQRVRDMAEVFTPAWICNKQNNLVDEAWFGRKDVFNTEYLGDDGGHCWKGTEGRIDFSEEPSRKSRCSWQDYVREARMEIACGEGPYLASRYDCVTGQPITDLRQRVGILDRKLRIVSENTRTTGEWIQWAKKALMATYGFEWQGDNLLLARKTLFFTVLDYYKEKFGEYPRDSQKKSLPGFAYIISWNIWQMDGLKMVVPYSCEGKKDNDFLFSEMGGGEKKCPACEKGNFVGHIGTPCVIRDWKKPKDKQKIEFQSLFRLPSGK